MLQHNAKTTVHPKGPHNFGAGTNGDPLKVSKGPQDSTTQTAEQQAKLKGRSVADILYPNQGK